MMCQNITLSESVAVKHQYDVQRKSLSQSMVHHQIELNPHGPMSYHPFDICILVKKGIR
jgi:hypothetical protein